jgi:1-acyl-sn-glycerol-3-phosphate acyltransferase
VSGLVAVFKLVRVLWHALVGYFTIVFVFPRLAPAAREARVQAWAQELLQVLGLTVQVRGEPVAFGPALIVANHISWLDIVALHAGRHCCFVAKSDVHHWPLIGRLATGAGTLYIERESRRDALRVVHHMADSLRAGQVLAVFPEGTTSDGVSLLPFHANLLQAAIAADAPVQPVALGFIDRATGQRSLAPCYIGDDTLAGSLWRTLTSAPITVTLHYGVPQTCDGRDRRVWAVDLRAAIDDLRTGAPTRPAERQLEPVA